MKVNEELGRRRNGDLRRNRKSFSKDVGNIKRGRVVF